MSQSKDRTGSAVKTNLLEKWEWSPRRMQWKIPRPSLETSKVKDQGEDLGLEGPGRSMVVGWASVVFLREEQLVWAKRRKNTCNGAAHCSSPLITALEKDRARHGLWIHVWICVFHWKYMHKLLHVQARDLYVWGIPNLLQLKQIGWLYYTWWL